MRDLERDDIAQCIKSFSAALTLMRDMRGHADKLYYKHQKDRWFLHAVETYCEAIGQLCERISKLQPCSQGLLTFRDFAINCANSDTFISLKAAAEELARDLADVHYCILIKDAGFRVRKYESESDYSSEIAKIFEKFQQDATADYRVEFRESKSMNHIEAKVLEFVARLYPELFARLDTFCAQNRDYADPTLVRFDREIQFYISYLEYIRPLKQAGLSFCYPEISATSKEIYDEDGFDLALAAKLAGDKAEVVRNSFHLAGKERVFIVSGPNQGGKTTFARSFGQLHHLASIGCPVPGRRARLFLFDDLYVHFEREEDIRNLHGKLQDDLIRIHQILNRTTPGSIIIMNEIFTSTALKDGMFLARKVIDAVLELDCLCVCVTFMAELSSMSGKTVSMVSTVLPDSPAIRTFKVVRRPADGRSYALSIAEKYRVTYEQLKSRIAGPQ
jgi:DNA mismatch repair ATPase MutS